MFVSGRGRGSSRMPCESCAVQFSIFRLKRLCLECGRFYCAACMRRGGGSLCAPCRALCSRPLSRHAIAHLRVRDLQCFLHRQNVSTRGCVEKEELISLCVTYVNGADFRRGRGTFGSSLKGFTNNINNLIHSAFNASNVQQQGDCQNRSHAHSAAPRPAPRPASPSERFTTTPGGEADIIVPVPSPRSVDSSGSAGTARLDSADCFEVEDLDDTWELLHTPGETLPNDSSVLMEGGPMRATSEVDLSHSHSHSHNISDSTSLHEEALHPARPAPAPSPPPAAAPSPPPPAAAPSPPPPAAAPSPPPPAAAPSPPPAPAGNTEPEPVQPLPSDTSAAAGASEAGTAGTRTRTSLASLESVGALDALSVRALKELLVRNRVDTRGCLERNDLLDRARTLWREHNKYKDQLENLPLEECCKICMAAPLECVLLECGHIATCTACAAPLHECPICRRYVTRAVRFFRS